MLRARWGVRRLEDIGGVMSSRAVSARFARGGRGFSRGGRRAGRGVGRAGRGFSRGERGKGGVTSGMVASLCGDLSRFGSDVGGVRGATSRECSRCGGTAMRAVSVSFMRAGRGCFVGTTIPNITGRSISVRTKSGSLAVRAAFGPCVSRFSRRSRTRMVISTVGANEYIGAMEFAGDVSVRGVATGFGGKVMAVAVPGLVVPGRGMGMRWALRFFSFFGGAFVSWLPVWWVLLFWNT